MTSDSFQDSLLYVGENKMITHIFVKLQIEKDPSRLKTAICCRKAHLSCQLDIPGVMAILSCQLDYIRNEL